MCRRVLARRNSQKLASSTMPAASSARRRVSRPSTITRQSTHGAGDMMLPPGKAVRVDDTASFFLIPQLHRPFRTVGGTSTSPQATVGQWLFIISLLMRPLPRYARPMDGVRRTQKSAAFALSNAGCQLFTRPTVVDFALCRSVPLDSSNTPLGHVTKNCGGHCL